MTLEQPILSDDFKHHLVQILISEIESKLARLQVQVKGYWGQKTIGRLTKTMYRGIEKIAWQLDLHAAVTT